MSFVIRIKLDNNNPQIIYLESTKDVTLESIKEEKVVKIKSNDGSYSGIIMNIIDMNLAEVKNKLNINNEDILDKSIENFWNDYKLTHNIKEACEEK